MKSFAAVILLLTLVMSNASAQIPETMSYQGVLVGPDSTALEGTHTLTFQIYSSATGGTALWSETHSSVMLNDGVFDVILGTQGSPLTLNFDGQYFLGVTVNSELEELSPRLQMASSPYSLNARNAEDVSDEIITSSKIVDGAVTEGKVGDEAVTAAKIGDGAVTEAKIADDAVTEAKIGNGAVTEAKIADEAVTETKIPDGTVVRSINGMTDNVTLSSGGEGDGHSLDAADGDPVDVVYVDNNGLVGVGTQSPLRNLHLRFSESASDETSGKLVVENTTGPNASIELRVANTGLPMSSLKFYKNNGTFTRLPDARISFDHTQKLFGFVVDGVQRFYFDQTDAVFTQNNLLLDGERNTFHVGSEELVVNISGDYEQTRVNGLFVTQAINASGNIETSQNINASGTVGVGGNLNVTGGVGISGTMNAGTINASSLGVSGTINASSLDVSGNIAWGSGGALLVNNQGGSIELGGSGNPFIDFKNSTSDDYDVRIELVDNNTLQVVGGTLLTSSDRRLKKNFRRITNPLSKIQQLGGYTFQWRTNEYPGRKLSERGQAGVVAQEVKSVLPEAVTMDGQGFLAVDYDQLAPLFIEALKAQQSEIENQKEELAALRKELESLQHTVRALVANSRNNEEKLKAGE